MRISSKTHTAIGLLASCVYGGFVYIGVQRTPLWFDDALNWLVALNLRDHLSYTGRYYPFKIYDSSITTNGPVQYIAAGLAAVLPFDEARSLLLALAAAALFMSVFLLSRWTTLILVAITLYWAILWNVLTLFLGEVTAVAMLLFGVGALAAGARVVRKAQVSAVRDALAMSLRTPAFWLAGALFGVAVSTKLLVVLFVPLICLPVLSTVMAADERPRSTIGPRNLIMTAAIAIFITLLAVGFFVGQIVLSVSHTLLALRGWSLTWQDGWAVLEAVTRFVSGHLTIGQRNTSVLTVIWPPRVLQVMSSQVVVVAMAVAGMALVARSLTFLPLVGVILVLGNLPDANERRLLPLVAIIVLLGGAVIVGDSPLGTILPRLGRRRPKLRQGLTGIVLASGLVFAGRSGHVYSPAWQVLSADHTSAVHEARVRLDYRHSGGSSINMTQLLDLVQAHNTVVVTSGWWQFPELAVRSGVTFYDRMALPNQSLRDRPEDLLLLFDEGLKTWPETSTRLCGEVIYRQSTFVLCRFNRAYPLNERSL